MNSQKKITLTNWTFRQQGKGEWLEVNIPGSVHTDLWKHRKTADPFYRLNEKDQQWIERKDWEYETYFEVKKEWLNKDRASLIFEGIDTFATITLNGKKILETRNMFHPWRIEVKNMLKAKENHLHVYFHSPYHFAEPEFDAYPYQLPANNDEGEKRVSPFVRKAPYQFGWDWGPRLLTSGFWQDVFIEFSDTAKINDIHFTQKKLTDKHAVIEIKVELEAFAAFEGELQIDVENEQNLTKQVKVKPGKSTQKFCLEIGNPKRWWTHDLGTPFLYVFQIKLLKNNKLIDSKQQKTGLRTIELVRDKDEKGESFYFKLNGKPVYMRGANIIPIDYFPHRVTNQKYHDLIDQAKKVNMNMLRAWGGAYYEKDIFYDLCDENGILVWQDFMFACGMYPSHDDYLENIKNEIEYNIKRLRNHACLALWCGNNEVLEGFHTWGWKDDLGEHTTDAYESYKKVFYDFIPETVNKLDPSRHYWPSSPTSDWDAIPNLKSGDLHYWEIIKGDKEISEYTRNIGRFMSEYGFKCYPEMRTLKTYTTEEDRLNIRSETMEEHQGWPNGADLIENNLKRELPQHKNYDAFLFYSQILQAKAISTAITAHRLAKPYCMGTLYWQLNDVWPCASWSSVDYFGRWKALHYELKRLFSPIFIAAKIDKKQIEFRVINDLYRSFKAQIVIRLRNFSGLSLLNHEFLTTVYENSNQQVFSDSIKNLVDNIVKDEVFVQAEIWENGKLLSQEIAFLVKEKHLKLPDSKIQQHINIKKNKIEIELQARAFTPWVYLDFSECEGFFSDNYFHLLPGKTKIVDFTPKEEFIEVKNQLQVMSLKNARNA